MATDGKVVIEVSLEADKVEGQLNELKNAFADLGNVGSIFGEMSSIVDTFSNTFKADFQKTRQVIDIILVISCISLSLIFQCGFALREGTIIATCIFSPIMGFVQRSVTKGLSLQKG